MAKTPTDTQYESLAQDLNTRAVCSVGEKPETLEENHFVFVAGPRVIEGIDDMIYLQDFNTDADTVSKVMDTMTEETVYNLKDKRDDKSYPIAKLKDGKVWLLQNLAISDYTCKPEDSNVASEYVIPKSSTSGFTGGLTDKSVYVDSMMPRYGGYYGHAVAFAGAETEGEQANSIAPAGWKIPTAQEYTSLLNAYASSSSDLRDKGRFELSGYYLNGSPHEQGSEGAYYASTLQNSHQGMFLLTSTTATVTNRNEGTTGGYSIRCIVPSAGGGSLKSTRTHQR